MSCCHNHEGRLLGKQQEAAGVSKDVDIWIEAEDLEATPAGYCNVIVTHDDGAVEAFNVWTISHVTHAWATSEDGVPVPQQVGYLIAPDLIVADLTRPTIERAVRALLALRF